MDGVVGWGECLDGGVFVWRSDLIGWKRCLGRGVMGRMGCWYGGLLGLDRGDAWVERYLDEEDAWLDWLLG